MSKLILSSKRITQPAAYDKIDWSNPLTDGLKIGINFGYPIDLVRNIPLIGIEPTITQNATRHGVGLGFSGSQTAGGLTLAASDFYHSGIFSVATGWTTQSTAQHALVEQWESADNAICWLSEGTTSYYAGYLSDSSNVSLWSGGTISTDRVNNFIQTNYNSNTAIYQDGIAQVLTPIWVAGFPSAARVKSAPIRIGSNLDNKPLHGTLLWFYAWDRCLSAAEAKSIADYPWQLFTPQKRVIYFAGGASSGNSILSEGFSAADSFSAATIRAALLSESSNSTDSLLPSAQYGRSLSETNALSAIVAASRATQTGLSESGSSQDATNAISSSVVALQETNAVAALQSATGLYGAGLQESNAANETLAATGSQESSLAETSSIQATQAALYAASANLPESSSVIDTQAAASLIAALVNESISLFDTVDTQTAGVSYIAELIITGDSLSASRTTGAQVVENSGVTDSRSAVKRTNAVLAESQPSLDAVSAESSSIVTLTESSSVASVIALAAATVSVTLTESSILAAQVSAQAMLQVLLGESAVLSDQHGSPQTANVAILEVSAVSDTVINIVFAVSAESRDIVEIRVKEVVESISVGRDRIVAVKTIDTQNIIKGSGMLVHVRLNN